MATTELVFDITSQSFVQSLTQPVLINPLDMYSGDVKHLLVTFCKRISSNAVQKVSGVGLSVQMAIGVPAVSPTIDTSATAAAADANDAFAITLHLDVAAVVTAIGSNSVIQRTLEFMLSIGGEPERYQTKINLHQRLITGTLTDPVPPAVALSSTEALSIFVPRNGALTGYEDSGFIMVDEEDITKKYLVSIRAGQMHVELIA